MTDLVNRQPEGPDGRPDCGYCAERLAVNVGLLVENAELKRKLAGREPAPVEQATRICNDSEAA